MRTAPAWYLRFRDHLGRRRTWAAFTDKRASEELGRKLERLVFLRVAGQQPDPTLTRWLETLPAKWRARLARIGVLDGQAVAANRPLGDHLVEFKQALLDKGSTGTHAHNTAQSVAAILDGTGAEHLSDLDAAAVSRYLAERRADGLSVGGSNHYLTALKSFCNWLVRERRASTNPVAHLSKLNERMDKRRKRRPFPPDELRHLLATTTDGPERFGMAGPERALLYRVAAETGLRAGELRSLTRVSFALDGPEPTVTVTAAYSKRRRDDVLPLRPDTASELRTFLANKLPGVRAFNMPKSDKTATMLRADLTDAGIPYRDDAGRVLDFHSLRVTFATNLAAGGAHPKTAQELLRHSTIGLTLDTYTHATREQAVAALDTLPDLSQPGRERGRATGTDDHSARNSCAISSTQGTQTSKTVQPGAPKPRTCPTHESTRRTSATASTGVSTGQDGTGPGRIRTCDQSIMSRLL